MKLSKDEYTIQTLLDKLIKEYGKKITGKPFTKNDITQYLIKGNIPYRYGGDKVSVALDKKSGIKIIKLIPKN